MKSLVSCVLGLFVLGVAFGPTAVTCRNPDQIHLSLVVSWQGVDVDDGLSLEAQMDTMEIITRHMEQELGANVQIDTFLPSLGSTPHGHLYTVSRVLVDRKPAPQSATRLGKNGRKTLAINSDPSAGNITAADSIQLLRDVSTANFLKQRITSQVLGRQATTTSTRRTLLAQSTIRNIDRGRVNVILVEEEIRFSKIGGIRAGAGQKKTQASTPKRKPTKVSAEEVITKSTIVDKNAIATSANSGKPKNRFFQAKFFADGPGARAKLLATAGARYNLDRINQAGQPLDGNVALPSFFFPPQVEAHIYILDTIVMTSHVEFGGRAEEIWNGFPDEDGTICESHGTHTAATAGGATVGVNRAARVFTGRVLNCEGFGYTTDLIAGTLAVKQHCTTVGGGKANRGITVSMSFGGEGDPNAPGAAPYAYVLGQLRELCDASLFAAAGNSATDSCMFIPAGYNDPSKGGVIAIGATDSSDVLAPFSNFGRCVSLQAPGVDIVSAGIASNTALVTMSGTSMACPLAAGVASLHMTRRPTFWYSMHSSVLFTDNVKSKMLMDAVNVVTGLPNTRTTARLLQVNSHPISTTTLLPPVSPQAPPPSSRSVSGAASLYIVSFQLTLLVALSVMIATSDFPPIMKSNLEHALYILFK